NAASATAASVLSPTTRAVAGGAAGDPAASSRPTTKAPTPTARAGASGLAGRESPVVGQTRLTARRSRNRTVRTGAGPAPATPRRRGRAVRMAQPAATTTTAARGAATAGRGAATASWPPGALEVT